MSRGKRRRARADQEPDSMRFSVHEPQSMKGTKYWNQSQVADAEARFRSRLPYVSWERPLRSDDEALAAGINYLRELPEHCVNPNTLADREVLNAALKQAKQRLAQSGLPKAIGLTKASLRSCCPIPRVVRVTNRALTIPFYSWNVDEAKLLRCARISVRQAIHGSLVHLIQPDKPRVRFTQGGEGFAGLNPRLTAWRAWIDFQSGIVQRRDYFMDLQSFAWLTLQHDIVFQNVLIGGTIVQEGQERRVLHAVRSHDGWFVDEWCEDSKVTSAILLMS